MRFTRFEMVSASIVLTMLAALFFGGATPARAAEAETDSVQVTGRARGAVLRSLALPGWGQFYNGKKWKGGVIAVAEVGSAVGYFVRRNQLQDRAASERNWFLISTIGIVLYSMADAYVDAYMAQVDWAEVRVGVDEDGAVQVQMRMRFK